MIELRKLRSTLVIYRTEQGRFWPCAGLKLIHQTCCEKHIRVIWRNQDCRTQVYVVKKAPLDEFIKEA